MCNSSQYHRPHPLFPLCSEQGIRYPVRTAPAFQIPELRTTPLQFFLRRRHTRRRSLSACRSIPPELRISPTATPASEAAGRSTSAASCPERAGLTDGESGAEGVAGRSPSPPTHAKILRRGWELKRGRPRKYFQLSYKPMICQGLQRPNFRYFFRPPLKIWNLSSQFRNTL